MIITHCVFGLQIIIHKFIAFGKPLTSIIFCSLTFMNDLIWKLKVYKQSNEQHLHIQYQLIHCTFMSSLASLFTGSVRRASFYRRMGHQTHLRPQWLSLQTVLVEVLISAGRETLRTVLTELQKHCTEGDVPHHGSDKILSRS